MAQQYKPRRRSARNEGLLPPRRQVNKKPIAIVVALLLCAALAFGLSRCVQCSGPVLPTFPQPQQQQEESSSAATPSQQEQGSSVAIPESSKSSSAQDGESSAGKDSDGKKKAKSLSDVEKSQDKATDYEEAKLPESEGTGAAGGGDGESAGSASSDGSDSDTTGNGGGSNSGSGNGSSSTGSGSGSGSSKSSSKLASYYDSLDSQSDRLVDFVENTYNSDLYKSLKTRKADYEKFKKLRDSILSKLTDSDGNWLVEDYSVSGSSKKKAKKNLKSASDLLYERLQIIENAYEAITSLDKDASKKEIKKASDKACKNSQSTYASFEDLMSSIGDVL